MFGRTLKNTLGFLFWTFTGLLVGVVTIATVTSSYLALSYAFWLLRYDGQPISEDTFVGQIFQAFCPQATLAQFYGATLAVGLAFGFFLVFKEAFGCYDAWLAGRLHRAEGNVEQAQAFKWELVEKTIVLALVGAFLGLVVAWDVELFRYRSAAQIAGLDDPGTATGLVTWRELMDQPNFALNVTQIGTWGYLALTAVLCLSLEVTGRKSRRYFDRILADIEGIGGTQEQVDDRVLRGYDASGQPVYDAVTPLAYDAEGSAREEAEAATPARASEESTTHARTATANPPRPEEPAEAAAPLFVAPAMGRAEAGAARQEPPKPASATEPTHEPARESEAATFTVIGTGERVAWMHAVLDRERYYCDLGTRIVWDRTTYESLHAASVPDEPEPMAA
jgi:hypothetical protein